MTIRWLLPLSLFSACTWVDQADLDERLGQLDNDGDGFFLDGDGDPTRVDCDDTNPHIYPGADDPWYDGVDSNCDEVNDYDADGDGWVVEGCEDNSDCAGTLGFGDCEDDDAAIFPGATDAWYDGIDTDCSGTSDYDSDGDSFDSSARPGGTDCDDTNDAIFPGATDVWYDGVDSDCNRANDYDADGDGWVVEGCEGTSDCEGRLGFGDCLDEDNTSNPGAVERWYDGVDSDCEGDDDFDADADGYDAIEYGGDDCDDDEELIFPGGDEDLTDGVDEDCDGSATSIALERASVTLLNPHNLRADEYEGVSPYVFLSVAAEQFTFSTGGSYYDTAVALPMSNTANLWGPMSSAVAWASGTTANGSSNITDGHTFIIEEINSKYFMCGGWGLIVPSVSSRALRINCYQISTGGSGPGTRVGVVDAYSSSTGFDDIAFGVDRSGNFHAFGCAAEGSGTLQYIVATEDDIEDNTASNGALYTGVRAERCSVHFQDSDERTGTLAYTDADSGEYVVATFDAVGAATNTLPSTYDGMFTEIYRGTPTVPRDIELYNHTQSNIAENSTSDSVGELLVDNNGTITLWINGVVSNTPVVIPATNAINANFTVETSSNNVNNWTTVYVTWVTATGTAGLAWFTPGSSVIRTATLNTDLTPAEALPYLSGTGKLVVSVLGEDPNSRGSYHVAAALVQPAP